MPLDTVGQRCMSVREPELGLGVLAHIDRARMVVRFPAAGEERIYAAGSTDSFTTFFLSDRKSESYAIEWRHVDFAREEIQLHQALDRNGNIKSTKGDKKTTFKAPKELMNMLYLWKQQQSVRILI